MKVLVAGAGIAGLTLVSALAKSGIAIDVAEHATQLHAVGAGIILQPNGMTVLRALGFDDDVLRCGSAITHMTHSRNGHAVSLPLDVIWNGSLAPTAGIRRSDLQTLLLRRAERLPEVRIAYGLSVAGLRERGDRVAVRFTDETAGDYDLVVGADGVNSRVRQLLFPSSQPAPTGLQWWRMIAVRPRAMAAGEWVSADGPDGSFGIYPIGRGVVHSHVMFRGFVPPCPPGTERSYLEDVVARWHPLIGDVIRARRIQPHFGVPMMVRPPVWGTGRSILIGDAAHAIAPTLSQGGSLAMEDAYALAMLLRNGGPERLVERFTALREPSVSWALKMATAQVNAHHRDTAVAQPPAGAGFALRYMQRMYAPLVAHSAELLALPKVAQAL